MLCETQRAKIMKKRRIGCINSPFWSDKPIDIDAAFKESMRRKPLWKKVRYLFKPI